MTVYCPKCMEPDASVSMDLIQDGADPEREFRCFDCDEVFTRQHIDDLIVGAARWARVLKWVDAMPTEEQLGAQVEAQS